MWVWCRRMHKPRLQMGHFSLSPGSLQCCNTGLYWQQAYWLAPQYLASRHPSFTAAPSPLYQLCHWKHLQWLVNTLSSSCWSVDASHADKDCLLRSQEQTEGNRERWSLWVSDWQIVLGIFYSFFDSMLSKQHNRHFYGRLIQGCSKFYWGWGTHTTIVPSYLASKDQIFIHSNHPCPMDWGPLTLLLDNSPA